MIKVVCGNNQMIKSQYTLFSRRYKLLCDAEKLHLPKALNNETISCLLSWKLGRWLLEMGKASICRSENKIFSAVPNP